MRRRSCPRWGARRAGWGPRRTPWSARLLGEGRRPHPPVVPELEEEPVAAGRGEGRREADRVAAGAVLGGVDVQEGKIALAQRDQMAARAEVRLYADGVAVQRDGEPQPGLPA